MRTSPSQERKKLQQVLSKKPRPVKSDLENVCQYSGLPSVSSYKN